jgi:hypothetical protein
MSYNFTLTLHPWGNPNECGDVKIDPEALYGAWDHKDGSEGGGLWFELLDDGRLDLVDYDGYYYLPKAVVKALREAGVSVDETFE